ncbi:tetratricopeptide repeat protein [Lignipirellula cremea]|uniref:Tetratricopeptide repeat protein n=1 Tax=Lignipirellula cremea TaxID=2528010 RepID=A0A518E191_9BACT|nr:tetratricopeptide repeat protein [Lignipirellula cremea]QDU97831.1 Tetratricopeptide repeat protein [Lignipirellula cremea]
MMIDSRRGQGRTVAATPSIFAAVAMAAGLLASLAGCGDKFTPVERGESVQLTESGSEDISTALDKLGQIDKSDLDQHWIQGLYAVRRWLDTVDPPADWRPDPMLDSLPTQLAEMDAVANLSQKTPRPEEIEYLLECIWARDITRWVLSDFQDPSLALFNARAAEGSDNVFADREEDALGEALRLFDFTVRHVQLEPLLEAPPAAEPTEAPAPTRLVDGPGYMQPPWKALLMASGDAWQRSRVFIALCRAANIDAVMLGIASEEPGGPVQPWLAAAAVQGQLYLFDAQLGVPIPGPQPQSIATLAQLQADPQLLRKLDIGGSEPHVYPVQAADLSRVVALIDAPVESLSIRTRMIEDALVGEQRLRAVVDPSALAARIQACEGIEECQLWEVPFQTTLYNVARKKRAGADETYRQENLRDEIMYYVANLSWGRRKHFRGIFSDEGDDQGAKSLFLELRLPETRIEQLPDSKELQRAYGFDRNAPRDEALRKQYMQLQIPILRRAKQRATLWLGLALYDSGDFRSAGNWFDRVRTDPSEIDVCRQSATYNLGRSLEAQGEPALARDMYYLDKESPQLHGNLLRARLLILAEDQPAGDGSAAAPGDPEK